MTDTSSEAHRHHCEVKEVARWLYLSMYAKTVPKRIEMGDKVKRYLALVAKLRGQAASDRLDSDAKEFLMGWK